MKCTMVRGFTLTEIMVGVVIMAIILFPALMVIMNESRVVTGTRDHSQAAFIAQNLVETARTYKFESLGSFVDEYKDRTYPYNGIEYTVNDLAIAEIKPASIDQVAAFKLSFSVRYTSREGRAMSLDLGTIIGRHE